MAQIVIITNPLTGQPTQVDQLDHTAQQIDDGLNIARGVSNPNLLDNWYFGNPVNQRGVSGTISDPGYFIDRWKLISGTVQITQYGLVLNGTISQILENSIGYPTKATALASDGVFDAVYDDAAKTLSVTASGKTIIAAKLELGDQQTLAHQDVNGNWVLNEIPNYAEELAKCQWYSREMYVAMQGVKDVYGLIRQSVTFPSMRITPTATPSKSGGTEPNTEIALLNNGGFVLSAYGSEENFKSWYGRIFLNANL